MEMKTVATFYYAVNDKNGNTTSNKNFNKNSDGDYVGYSKRMLYKDKSLLKPVAFWNNHQNNIQNKNKTGSKINNNYLHERIKIYDLHKNGEIELTNKMYEFEAVYIDNSVDGITTVKNINCKGKDSNDRVIYVTINYDNDASSPASWNPEKFSNFRQVIIKRAYSKKH